jgi:hypothetical protein
MQKKSFLPLLALVLLLTACNLPSSGGSDAVALGVAQTQLAQTQAALDQAGQDTGLQPPPDQDPDAGSPDAVNPDTPAPIDTPTITLTPSPTLTPTNTLTPTQDKPMASVSVDTNCRTGPGKQYDIIGALLTGETAEVIGKSADGQYWIIKNPDRSGECWLWAYYADVTGPTAALPVVTQPPTPTPQFLWAGAWDSAKYPIGGMGVILTLNSTVNGRSYTGVMNIPVGDPVLLSGTISDDWLSVSGNWTAGANQGTFKFFALGTNQFNGNSKNGETWQWCGARGGAALPDPCFRE